MMIRGAKRMYPLLANGIGPFAAELKEKIMIARKIVITAALLVSATSAALAQSAWTTGSAADRERAGYGSPSQGSLYAYVPGYVARHSVAPGALVQVPNVAGNPYSPAATGGGSTGYNWMVEHNY